MVEKVVVREGSLWVEWWGRLWVGLLLRRPAPESLTPRGSASGHGRRMLAPTHTARFVCLWGPPVACASLWGSIVAGTPVVVWCSTPVVPSPKNTQGPCVASESHGVEALLVEVLLLQGWGWSGLGWRMLADKNVFLTKLCRGAPFSSLDPESPAGVQTLLVTTAWSAPMWRGGAPCARRASTTIGRRCSATGNAVSLHCRFCGRHFPWGAC